MKNTLFFFPSVLFLFFSCAEQNSNISRRVLIKVKEPAHVSFPENNTLLIRDELSSLQTPTQTFWINPLSDTVLTGWQGTTLSISKGCIGRQDGSAPDKIMIELKEVFSKSDIVLNNKPTVSNRQVLITGGVIYVNARSGKENLIIQCPEGIQASVPKNDRYTNMELFMGEHDRQGNLNWVKDSSLTAINMDPLPEDGDGMYYEGELLTPAPFYMFSLRKFGWINCDAFSNDEREKVALTVRIQNGVPEDYTTRMFAVFEKQNSIIPLYSKDHMLFTSSDLPVGEEIYVVTLSGKDQRFYMDIQSSRIKKGKIEEVNLKECSKEEIKKRIEVLN